MSRIYLTVSCIRIVHSGTTVSSSARCGTDMLVGMVAGLGGGQVEVDNAIRLVRNDIRCRGDERCTAARSTFQK